MPAAAVPLIAGAAAGAGAYAAVTAVTVGMALSIGTAVATVAVIFGQLAMSMLIDNFGWLHNEAIPFSATRLGAVVCLGIALWFIYSGSKSRAVE